MLRTAIESILAQKCSNVEFEVIIVDDGSTDHTPDIAAQFPVKYVRGDGQGVSVARNLGLAIASGEYIAFLDDDDIWATGYPHTQAKILETPWLVCTIFYKHSKKLYA